MTDAERLLKEKYGGVPAAGYDEDLQRLSLDEPLAYVIGWQPFLGLKIYLDSKPLIPRPETEWWTEEFIAVMRKEPGLSSEAAEPIKVLDLCAGSGAIGCAVLKNIPDAHVYFGEIDPAHASTILKNIRENRLDESRAVIGIGDLFEPFGDLQFDVIAANPPYIPEKRALPASVAHYEPARALFGGEDGLTLIQRIAEELPKRLTKGGSAWIECDSAHTEEACKLFQKNGLVSFVRRDQYGAPRAISVTRI